MSTVKRKALFLISSLAAAGFRSAADAQAVPLGDGVGADTFEPPIAARLFKLDHRFILAGHSSHSSHSSHASHSSGSGGGSYSPPTYHPPPRPAYRPPTLYSAPTPLPAPSAAPAAPRTLSGRSELFTQIVRRVQMGLSAYGYYRGPLSGMVDADTRAALSKFQGDYKIKVTGTITPEVLDSLRIVAE